MDYFRLGNIDEKISRIGFGCAAISGFDYGKIDEKDAIKAIQKSWEYGVNMYDTADVYGFGYTEKILAKALGSERHDVLIATKFGINWDNKTGNTFRDCSVKRMNEALDKSLRRLELDCIPIYIIHWYDGVTPFDELMNELKKCQEKGKIRYIGCSNFSEEMILNALKTHKIDFIQYPFNLINKDKQRQLENSFNKMSISTIVYDVLARGLLTAKYDNATFGENDTRSKHKYFNEPCFSEGLAMVNRLKKIANLYQKSPAQIAMKWVLEQPYVDCLLVGIKNVNQLSENIDLFNWDLDSEHYYQLSK